MWTTVCCPRAGRGRATWQHVRVSVRRSPDLLVAVYEAIDSLACSKCFTKTRSRVQAALHLRRLTLWEPYL